jgi:lipopolysaccharide export system protein LptA
MPRAGLVVPMLALAALLLVPSVLAAQAGACRLRSSQSVDRRADAGTVYIVAPDFVCAGGTQIRAAEATVMEHLNQVQLTGNVHYVDPDRELTSEYATYDSRSGRLHARGNVVLVDRTEGSTLRGPELEYFRAMEGRPEAQMYATGRPRLTVPPKPGEGPARGALDIDADQINSTGPDRIQAVGRVEIRGPDLDASGQHADLDRGGDRLVLRGGARMRSERFMVAGEEIDARFPGGAMEHLLARREARLEGEDITVVGEEIQVFMEADEVQRLVARSGEGSRRAVAHAREFRVEADSVDADAPGQRLQRVVAIGSARSESRDTLSGDPGGAPSPSTPGAVAPRRGATDLDPGEPTAPGEAPPAGSVATDRDWLMGDTIVATFAGDQDAEPLEEGDRSPRLEELLATGNASSLYRVRREEAPGAKPGLNYLSGEIIQLTFRGEEVDVARVSGLKQGLYLEPAAGPPTDGGNGASPGVADPEPQAPPGDGVDPPSEPSVPGRELRGLVERGGTR